MRTLFVAVTICALPALASSVYPPGIKTKLGLSAEPEASCALCHATSAGGDAVSKPFGMAMKGKGLMGGSAIPFLESALTQLEAAGTDSDGDGTGDVAELRAARNPNVADAVPQPMPPSPKYGCGADVVPALGGALALLTLGLRRRRR